MEIASLSSGNEGLPSKATRLLPLDALRGLIIVLMALDHANYFVAQSHSPGEYWGGPFPGYSDPLSFLTRFITHLAAPGFFFLMGAGMLLFSINRNSRGWSRWAVIRHFVIRGIFLIALQLLLVNRAWEMGPAPFPDVYIGVLVALGGAMILASFFLDLNENILLALTLIFFLGTEALHPNPGQWGDIINDPLNLILLRSGGDANFWVNYPILPWLELVVFGLLFGKWLASDPQRAYRRGLILGLGFLALFFILRIGNQFGNIRPREGNSWMDFLNVVKYPPSMTFTLITMGINLPLLWLLSRASSIGQRFMEPLAVFGRAPLFVYIIHLFLYMLIGRLLAPEGVPIPVMGVYWLLGLLILYPLTLAYGTFKARQAPESILRFL